MSTAVAEVVTAAAPPIPTSLVCNGIEIQLSVGKAIALCYTKNEAWPATITDIRLNYNNEPVVDLMAKGHRQSVHYDTQRDTRIRIEQKADVEFKNVGFFDPCADLRRRQVPLEGHLTIDGHGATTDAYYAQKVRAVPKIDGGLIPGKWFDPELWTWKLDCFLGERRRPGQPTVPGKTEIMGPFDSYADCYKRWYKEWWKKGTLRQRWDRVQFVAEVRR